MARNTAKFDWSMLDRQGLIQFLSEISPKLVGQELTNSKFHSIISKHIKSQLPVKVIKRSDTKVEFGHVYTGGAYYSDDDKARRQCIEIVFVYNPSPSFFFLIDTLLILLLSLIDFIMFFM